MAELPSAVPVTPKYGGTSLALMKYLSIIFQKHKHWPLLRRQTTYLWCAIKRRASFPFLSEPVVIYLSFKWKVPLWFRHVTMPHIGKLSSLMQNEKTRRWDKQRGKRCAETLTVGCHRQLRLYNRLKKVHRQQMQGQQGNPSHSHSWWRQYAKINRLARLSPCSAQIALHSSLPSTTISWIPYAQAFLS